MKRQTSSSLQILFYSLIMYVFFSFSVSERHLYFLRFSENPVYAACVFLCILYVCRKCFSLITQPRSILFYFLSFIVCAVFSSVCVMTRFFEDEYPLEEFVSTSPLAVCKLLALIISGMFVFWAVIQIIGSVRTLSFRFPLPEYINRFMNYMFSGKCFLKTFLLMTAIWLPQIIIRYPGALTQDARRSLLQYWKYKQFTTQHPVLYTILLGKFMDLGRPSGHADVAMFALVLLQTFFLLLVLAYTLNTMNKLHVPHWLLGITLLFFAVAPVFVSISTTVISDGIYNTFFLLLMVELVYYLYFHSKFIRSWKHYLLTALSMFGLNFRHNGIYAGMLVLVLAVLMEIFYHIKKETRIRYTLLVLAVIMLPLFGGRSLSNTLYQNYNARKYSTRAMLSLPIQQVSRCFAMYGDEIDKETLDNVQKVLTWDITAYKYVYDPLSFDNIKRGYKLTATSEDIKSFIQAWIHLFTKYPGTCITATLNQNYFLFNPQVVNQRYYKPYKIYIEGKRISIPELTSNNTVMILLNKFFNQCYYLFGYIPLLGLLINQGFTDLLLIVIALYALTEKKGKILFLCMPLLLTLATVFVGPMAYQQPRYTFSIIYSLPLLFGIFLTQSTLNRSKR